MKKYVAFIIIIIICRGKSQAQNQLQINNLATFTKVWGFLKYYHPEVQKGRLDWDLEYVKTVLTIKKIDQKKTFNSVIINCYLSLPKAKISNQYTQLKSDSILQIFNEQDFVDMNIPASLKKNLEELYQHHLPDSSKYVDNIYNGYKLDYVYHKEEPYAAPAFPDEGHRLLALARWWNIITYFYPHKAKAAPDWDATLTEFIPQMIAAANANEYRETFLRLINKLKDSHTWFKQKEWNAAHGDFMNVPFDVYYAGGKFVIGYSKYDSLMKANDLKIGDVIVAVKGLPIAYRLKQVANYTTGSNNASYYRDLGRNIFRLDSNTNLQITISRNGRLQKKNIKLYTYGQLYQYRLKHLPQIAQKLGNGIWYVRFCEIGNTTALKKMFNDIKDAKTVIWEMRDYPSFQITEAMWPGLIAKRVFASADYNAVLEFPGTFKKASGQIPSAPDTLGLPLFNGKLIVLVNEQTQSLAESVAMELRSRPNTVIVGRQTAGATGNMLFTDFPGGIEASYTAVKVVGANASFEQGRGVKIDQKIKLTPANIASTSDYLLSQAYQMALK
ncbi:hypothetical protein A0256_16090 [Mucilaginibacter sp. PAMC 26640]|nr:hypothetical protein A0256_16090 [Mucilaginibacter sp. PAMC 26640]